MRTLSTYKETVAPTMIRPKQRTKTGCFTCEYNFSAHGPPSFILVVMNSKGRRRKKKCGEESPICHRCSTSGYLCTWPSMRDLVDKRTRPFEQKTSFAHIEDPTKPYNASWLRSAHEIINNCWSLYSAPNALGASRIEYELLHHFFYQFLPGLLSSAWNKAHYMEYRNHLMELIMNFQGVKYAVLASCASNISMLTSNSRYQNIALGFYSHAVKDVNFALAEISSKNLTPSDALIVAVIYLYIHDVSFKCLFESYVSRAG